MINIREAHDAIPEEIMRRYNQEVSAPLHIMGSLKDSNIDSNVTLIRNMRNRISKTRTY